MSEQSERMEILSGALLDVSEISKWCGHCSHDFRDDDRCMHDATKTRMGYTQYCDNTICPIRPHTSNAPLERAAVADTLGGVVGNSESENT